MKSAVGAGWISVMRGALRRSSYSAMRATVVHIGIVERHRTLLISGFIA